MHKIDFLNFFIEGLKILQFQHRKMLPGNLNNKKLFHKLLRFLMLQGLSYKKLHLIYLTYLITANTCIAKENLNHFPYKTTPQNDIRKIDLVY